MENFFKSFLSEVTPKRMVSTEASPEMLIPILYTYEKAEITSDRLSSLLHLLGGGAVQADFPFDFSFSRLKTALLIYTESGGGCLTYDNRTISATGGSLLLHRGYMPFSLKSAILPWNFYVFFFDGDDIQTLTSFLPSQSDCCIKTDKLPSIRQNILHLLNIPPQITTLNLLSMHRALTNLLCLFAASELPAAGVPSAIHPYYLTQLKATFDLHYEKPFLLESYERLYQVSRYRLCREFSHAFGMPPLQYITGRRLEAAKEMLLTTDLTVQEISSRIGYDDVNHFIQLFKKRMGITPGNFRSKETL